MEVSLVDDQGRVTIPRVVREALSLRREDERVGWLVEAPGRVKVFRVRVMAEGEIVHG